MNELIISPWIYYCITLYNNLYMALIFIASALFILSILYSIIYYERINYEFDKDKLEKCVIYRKKVKKMFYSIYDINFNGWFLTIKKYGMLDDS